MSTNTVTAEKPQDRLCYTLDEAAQLCGLSARAFQEWHYAKKIKTIKLGRSVRIPAEEMQRIMNEGVK